jgi:hypothetical protein
MRRIIRHISMDREHWMQLGFALFFAMVIVAILLSAGATSTDSEIQGGKKNTTNQTYVDCVINASTVRTTCYNVSRITAVECRVAALNETKKTATKVNKCGKDFDKDYKKCVTAFKTDKKTCQKLNHTFYDEVKVAKYG